MYKKSNIATIRNISEFRFEGWGVSKTVYAIVPTDENVSYYLKISTKRAWFLRMGYHISGFATTNGSYVRVGILKECVF